VKTINPIIAVFLGLMALLSIYAWWSRRTKVDNRFKRTADFVFLWPLVLRGSRTGREKVFICVGVVIALLLICWSFTLPKP
jgi:hypothetical protein